MSDPFLDGGSGLPVLKFTDVGDGHKFQVIDAKQVKDYDLDGNIRTWPNGDERLVWVFEVDTTCTGSAADARVFVRGNLFSVVREALKTAGVGTIGAVIEAKHHALGEPTKKGYSPPKLFKARASAGPAIKPPADDFVGADSAEDPF